MVTQRNYERALASGEVPAEQQADLRRQIPHELAIVEQKRQREQGLRIQETELLNTLNAEQARWAEFNGRLDEIERSLSAPAREPGALCNAVLKLTNDPRARVASDSQCASRRR